MFTSDTVLSIIRHRGFLEINPMQYRNDKKMKVLKRMTKDGIIVRRRSSVTRAVFTMKTVVE